MLVSQYIIDVPLKNKDEYILIHGYSGAFDVVSKPLRDIIIHNDIESILKLDKSLLEHLYKRSYLTEKTIKEEYKTVSRIADELHSSIKNRMAITIIPTYNCNFRCSYCYEKGKTLFDNNECDVMKEVITTQTIDVIFKEINDFRKLGKEVERIILYGGEPLMKQNKHIVKYIVQKCTENKIKLEAVTNGYDLDEFMDLLGEDKISRLQITIDGPSYVHDKRRFLIGGKGTLEKIVSNINMFLDTKISANIQVRTNVNRKNSDNLDELLQMYNENMWLKDKRFSYYFKSTHKCYELPKNIISDDEIITKLENTIIEKDKYTFHSAYNQLEFTLRRMIETCSVAPFKSCNCGANSGLYTIDPKGDIYPCWSVVGDENQCIGKVDYTKKSFEFNDKKEFWHSRIVSKLDDCLKCKYALFCGGGCSAFANVNTQSYYNSNCDNFKSIFKEIVPYVYEKIEKKNYT